MPPVFCVRLHFCLSRCLFTAMEPMIDNLRYPDGTATQAVRIVAAQGSSGIAGAPTPGANAAATGDAAATASVGDDDPHAAARDALAWIGLHARAATVAEEGLAIEIAERDTKVQLVLFVVLFLR